MFFSKSGWHQVPDDKHSKTLSLENQLVSFSSDYATWLEFEDIKALNPMTSFDHGKVHNEIKELLYKSQKFRFDDLDGNDEVGKFFKVLNSLRYHLRWANICKEINTSVLGHMFFVSILAYLLASKIPNLSEKKLYKIFLYSLFHDLGEAFTRDILNPVKRRIDGLKDKLEKIEELKTEEYLKELPSERFKNEFRKIQELKNKNVLSPGTEKEILYDEVMKAADDLYAYIECYIAIENGSNHPDLFRAMERNFQAYTQTEKWKKFRGIGVDLREIYYEFQV